MKYFGSIRKIVWNVPVEKIDEAMEKLLIPNKDDARAYVIEQMKLPTYVNDYEFHSKRSNTDDIDEDLVYTLINDYHCDINYTEGVRIR